MHTAIYFFIDFNKVHFDTLHEHIRIPNHMLKVTHRLLIKQDKSDSKDIKLLPSQNKMMLFLQSLGIKEPFRQKGENDKLSDPNMILKTFSGSKAIKIALHMNKTALEDLKECEKIALLLNNYFRIHANYTHNFYNDKLEILQERCNEWQALFNSIFPEKHYTSYMHIFTDHLPHIIQSSGDIGLFTIQGY